ncbi:MULTISPECIES: Lrp/AsnC family transcriptional regulator [Bradyrhizobium]|uniref:Transcriptional regulator, AsnC family n=2 Tax=Bradyrhizobium TaxID=374 RepID=A0ABY0PF17_9BRAD|nr:MULTISPECIES: Lrp/AsnC family transcriptional regulator [Bradyrhizobium]SDI21006.1 transcriptional regulator, AsnC family [Bradyrhizobium ottawaense]SED73791.1 transcriptional regulator, AsnC family [Bradyrhizobium lablabi]SHL69506.1 transcriptional regulator, AsnC family [Bradyrhizobium lablabi]
MDDIDRKILACLQEDATTPLDEIARAAGLSPSPCWRRIRKLEASGVIQRRVALLDPQALGVGVTVFVGIRTARHNLEWAEDFCRAIARIPQVVEFYRMNGTVDYLLRIVVPDVDAYDVIYKKIINVAELYDVTSSFALEQIKYTTALPLDYVTVSTGMTEKK